MHSRTAVTTAERRPLKRNRGGVQPLPLSRDDILRAALPLLERDGVDGLTVRSIADELGISSPALYHYFAGRDDLLDRLCEQVAAEVDLRVDADTVWDDAIVGVLLNMHATFARFPGVAARVLLAPRHSPAADEMSRVVRDLIVSGGFEQAVADAVLASLQYLFAGWLLGRRPPGGSEGTAPEVLELSIRWLLRGAFEMGVAS